MTDTTQPTSAAWKQLVTVLASIALSIASVWLSGRPLPIDPKIDVVPMPHDPEIVGPESPVSIGRLAKFSLPGGVADTAGHWRVVARSTVVPDAAIVEVDGGSTAFVETYSPCVYDVSVAGSREGKVFHWATTFEVGGQPTPVPPPVPPEPTPEPPTPDVAPVRVPGFRALFTYESEQGLPAVFASAEVRAYLNAKCVRGEDGKTPDWRCWDQHIDPHGDFDVWQEFWKVPRQSLPWVVVSNGDTGFSGPAPDTVEGLISLLKKYGG